MKYYNNYHFDMIFWVSSKAAAAVSLLAGSSVISREMSNFVPSETWPSLQQQHTKWDHAKIIITTSLYGRQSVMY